MHGLSQRTYLCPLLLIGRRHHKRQQVPQCVYGPVNLAAFLAFRSVLASAGAALHAGLERAPVEECRCRLSRAALSAWSGLTTAAALPATILAQSCTGRSWFHEYAGGTTSLPKLALALNLERVPPPGTAMGWHEGTLRVILRNPVYKGQPASGKQKTVTDEGHIGQPNALTGRPLTTMTVRQHSPEDE